MNIEKRPPSHDGLFFIVFRRLIFCGRWCILTLGKGKKGKAMMNKNEAKFVALCTLISNENIDRLFNLVVSSGETNAAEILFTALSDARNRGENIYTVFLGAKLYSADVTREAIRQAQLGQPYEGNKKRFVENVSKDALKDSQQNGTEIDFN